MRQAYQIEFARSPTSIVIKSQVRNQLLAMSDVKRWVILKSPKFELIAEALKKGTFKIFSNKFEENSVFFTL